MILFYIVILLISFYLIARVADEYFVNSLDKISEKLKMSHDVAGATLMAVGSSAPELFVAIIALVKPGNHEAIGMGTIVGSALFNVLVIIGAAAIVRKAVLSWQPVIRDTFFYALSILMLIYAFRDGQIDFSESIIFVALYVIYIIMVMNWRKILPYKDIDVIEDLGEDIEKSEKKKWRKYLRPLDKILDLAFLKPKYFVFNFIMSIVIIAGLSWVLVESAIGVSEILHIPAAIIALTVLAAGTSIPDLLSSVIVAKQGRGCMAISNAIGSNIFDILFGLGVPWFIVLTFSSSGASIPVSTENLLTSVMLLFATVIVIIFLLMARRWKLGNKAGYFLIGLYILYLIWAISRVV